MPYLDVFMSKKGKCEILLFIRSQALYTGQYNKFADNHMQEFSNLPAGPLTLILLNVKVNYLPDFYWSCWYWRW